MLQRQNTRLYVTETKHAIVGLRGVRGQTPFHGTVYGGQQPLNPLNTF